MKRVRSRAARFTGVAIAGCVVTVLVGTTAANASLLTPMSSFGSLGAGAGQFVVAAGVAVDPSSGDVYVVDEGNARIEKFDATGHFISAWGWAVADGHAKSEVCTSNCRAGLVGSGPGQFDDPTYIAASADRVFVGDFGTDAVDVFDADGHFLSAIDGSTSPQGHFQTLGGVTLDQSGNLWTADETTRNIDEFTASGKFVRQWTDTTGYPVAIAVDSIHGEVYLSTAANFFETQSWTLNGTFQRTVDNVGGVALALDPSTGDLYVDGGGDIPVYGPRGIQLDDISVGFGGPGGLAFAALRGGSAKPGQHDLYVAKNTFSAENGGVLNSNVTIYTPVRTPGTPLITSESSLVTGKTTATVKAGVVPLGHATTCTVQYVDDATFKANGYNNATSVPCTPVNPGSSFTYQGVSANLSGLATPNVTYHFRMVASSSAGTTTGADMTFLTLPAAWAPFNRCPVDDPAMLAFTPGPNSAESCWASNSTHGNITIGKITATTGNTNLQAGLMFASGVTVVSPAGGALISAPVEILGGSVTATLEDAGTPSNFNQFAGIELDQPIITLPTKIHLESTTLPLGPDCFIGSDQNPIVLNPENTDLSSASFPYVTFDPNGAIDALGTTSATETSGAVQGDDTFAVPGATGCGSNDSLDGTVDSIAGLPSPSGSNHLVLDDASSALTLGPGVTGQQFANDWHSAFG